LQDAEILAIARPEELVLRIATEPVHVIDAGGVFQLRAYVQPVLPVVREVVAAEWLHGHRVATNDADLAHSCCRRLGGDGSTHQDAVLPIPSFVNERRDFAAPAAEHEGRNRYALRIFRMRRVAGIALGGDSKSRVGMGRGTVGRIVGPPLPIEYGFARGEAFPP